MASTGVIDLSPATNVVAERSGGVANVHRGAFEDVLAKATKADAGQQGSSRSETTSTRTVDSDTDARPLAPAGAGARVIASDSPAGGARPHPGKADEKRVAEAGVWEEGANRPETAVTHGQVAERCAHAEALEGAVERTGAGDSKENALGSEIVRDLAAVRASEGASRAVAAEHGRAVQVGIKGARETRSGKSRSEDETDEVGAKHDVAGLKIAPADGVQVVPVAMTVVPLDERHCEELSGGEAGATDEHSGVSIDDASASGEGKRGVVASTLSKVQEFGAGKLKGHGAAGGRGGTGAPHVSQAREHLAPADALEHKEEKVEFVAGRNENAAVDGNAKQAIRPGMRAETIAHKKGEVKSGAAAAKAEDAQNVNEPVGASATKESLAVDASAIPSAMKEAVHGAVTGTAVATTDVAMTHASVRNDEAAKTGVPGDANATRKSGGEEKRVKAASAGDDDRQTAGSQNDTGTPNAITATGSVEVNQSTAHANATVAVTSATAAIGGAPPRDRSLSQPVMAGHAEMRPEIPLSPQTMPANVTAIASRAAEALRHGEMHLGWDSEQLGRVDIKATVHGQEVSAAVKVESDAGRQWMTSELPKLADALGRQDFTVRSLRVMDFSAGDGQAHGGGSRQQQRWSQRTDAGGAERQGQARSALTPPDEESQQGLSIHV